MPNKHYLCKTMMTSVDEIQNMIGVQVLLKALRYNLAKFFCFVFVALFDVVVAHITVLWSGAAVPRHAPAVCPSRPLCPAVW